jgi:hypothetical protein
MRMPNEQYAALRIKFESALMEAIAERSSVRTAHPEWINSLQVLSTAIEDAKKDLENFLLENL